ncbi:hypothetical protein GCM10010412_054750 [Nonomuraea recticatena]|uniref:Secreted protein n=1 Tax=Nonomuraea recticatena TaxID=46178 RepID=A0ABN3SF55_9ACTN
MITSSLRPLTLTATALLAMTITAAPASAITGTATADTAAVTAAAGKKVHFRSMTLTFPPGWRVAKAAGAGGDWISVKPAGCGRTCAYVQLVGPKVLKPGPEDFLETYRTSRPFAPGTGVPTCRLTTGTEDGERFPDRRPVASGTRKVGAGHTAQYRAWRGECYSMKTDKKTRTFVQREWYLPKERILIVDSSGVAGLDQIVKAATWK